MKTIMIVDDDIELQHELKELLVSSGFRTVSCLNGDSALKEIPEIMPDLILLDMRLGKINGFQVAAGLKVKFGAGFIPVVVMTGYFTPEELSSLAQLCGVMKCFTKPINPEELISEIKKILII